MNKFGDYLKKYGVRLLVVVILVALVSGAAVDRSDKGASAVENISENMSLPAKKAATGVVGWLENIYGYMFRYDRLEEENRQLKERVMELEGQIREAEEAKAENENYRKLLELREQYRDLTLESAKVVDRGVSNWNTTFTLSKGEEFGIKLGDCVVDSSYNMVGQVMEVGDGWATVRSVIDTDMRVGTLVGESGAAAMIVGDFSLMRAGKTKLTYLTNDAQVFENDVLMTSGRGGTFPQGLVIGTVDTVYNEAGGQIEYATVTPAVDPDTLTQVFVVKSFQIVE